MIIVDDLLEVANSNRSAPKLVNFKSLLFFVLILRLQQLLILDELLLHQQIVFDSVLTKKTQSALGTRSDVWQLR